MVAILILKYLSDDNINVNKFNVREDFKNYRVSELIVGV